MMCDRHISCPLTDNKDKFKKTMVYKQIGSASDTIKTEVLFRTVQFLFFPG